MASLRAMPIPNPEPNPQGPTPPPPAADPFRDLAPPRRPNAGREDLYAKVTNQILADLGTGVRPWTKPWDAEHTTGRITRPLRANGQAYRGMNVLLLWSSAVANGFAAPLWMTFNQAKDLGGFVRAGSKGSPVVYADKVAKTEAKEDGSEEEKELFFMRQYTVFNAEQASGLPKRFYALAAPRLDPVQRIEHVEALCRNTKAEVRHGGTSAHYSPGEDRVQMPPLRRSGTPRVITPPCSTS